MRLFDSLLDLVLPQVCAGCGLAGQRWCDGCARELVAAASRPLGLHAPDPRPAGFPLAAAAASYEGTVRAALLAHKEHGRLGLVGPLAGALAAAVGVLAPLEVFLLVPVPSERAVVRARGHDHARRLAVAAARALRARGVSARASVELVPARRVLDQSGLGVAGRAANLAGALRARRPLPDCRVVVVDDVVTTGATLAEATRALRAAGATVHGAATVAATVRRLRAGPPPTRLIDLTSPLSSDRPGGYRRG